jgi:glycine/D-amino acid oxidase-like deaminating enzyme
MGCDPVAGDFDTDVAIIGGGYTGLSCAYHLARDHGVKAHVLEANRVGWGCSGRNGGFCSIGLGKEDFGDWIARFGLERAKATFEVGRDAVRTVHDALTDEAIDCDRTPAGGLELAHKPNRLPEMEARARRMNDLFGLDSQVLSKADLDGGYLASRKAPRRPASSPAHAQRHGARQAGGDRHQRLYRRPAASVDQRPPAARALQHHRHAAAERGRAAGGGMADLS